jgi:hypothetical protein
MFYYNKLNLSLLITIGAGSDATGSLGIKLAGVLYYAPL